MKNNMESEVLTHNMYLHVIKILHLFVTKFETCQMLPTIRQKIPEGVSARHCDNVTVVFRPCSNMTLAKE